MTTSNNKEIERIVEEFDKKFCTTVGGEGVVIMRWCKKDTPLPDVGKWLRQALTSYADQRVRKFILKARAKEEGIAELISRGGVDWRDHETRLDLLGKLLFLTHQDNE